MFIVKSQKKARRTRSGHGRLQTISTDN